MTAVVLHRLYRKSINVTCVCSGYLAERLASTPTVCGTLQTPCHPAVHQGEPPDSVTDSCGGCSEAGPPGVHSWLDGPTDHYTGPELPVDGAWRVRQPVELQAE